MTIAPAPTAFDPRQLSRPDPALMRYYLFVSLLTGPGFFFAILPLFFKYETLRYRFDDEGISMSWGILFRREIYLTYRRIQDIHLTRNLLQRWLGLATVSVQTTITFENVQNVEVRQGPLQRFFGIADVVVQTAGGGGKQPSGQQGAEAMTSHHGLIEGISHAPEIRDLILDRLRQSRTAGLGDELHQVHSVAGWSSEHLAVLREIRDLAKRRAVQRAIAEHG